MQSTSSASPDWVGTLPEETKIAIICPLYGYWTDLEVQQLTPQTLEASLFRLKSYHHKAYFIFVAESSRIDKGIKDIIEGKKLGNNALGIGIDPFSSYADYISEGIQTALERTDAQFIVVANPWFIPKDGIIDELVERVNKGDAQIVSGFDLRTYEVNGTSQEIDANQLDNWQPAPPYEEKAFQWNIWSMTRQTAEQIQETLANAPYLDPEYRTHYFAGADFWGTSHVRSLVVISDKRFPIYSFPIDWKEMELEEDYETDKMRFLNKWHFDPLIKYE